MTAALPLATSHSKCTKTESFTIQRETQWGLELNYDLT